MSASPTRAAVWAAELSARSLKKNAKLRELRRVFEQTGPWTGPALELGCGRGVVGLFLRQAQPAAEWLHADAAGSSLAAARELLPADAVAEAASFERLPWADESFNAVLLLDVLEHVRDDAELLREAWRVLRRDGTLVVSVPRRRAGQGLRRLARRLALPPESYGHVREGYTEAELTGLFGKAGLKLASVGDSPTADAAGGILALRPFCGPTTELLELLLNAAWRRRKKKTVENSGGIYAPANAAEFQSLGWRWTLYRAAYPLLCAAAGLDLILPRAWGYCLSATVRKK